MSAGMDTATRARMDAILQAGVPAFGFRLSSSTAPMQLRVVAMKERNALRLMASTDPEESPASQAMQLDLSPDGAVQLGRLLVHHGKAMGGAPA